MIYDLQKASTGKRISAFLFDIIMFMTVLVGIIYLISVIVNYDGRISELEKLYDEYEEEYDIVLGEENPEYGKMTEAEQKAYDERYAAAEEAFDNDKRAGELTVSLLSLTIMILTIGIFVTFLIMEFAIPLFLKNGQTLGKKIFGICLMRDDGVKISPVMLFVRSILGKYTIETMVPIFLLFMILFFGAGLGGVVALLAIFVLNVFLIIKTRTNSTIHDLLAYSVVVDKESQMIFETKEAMVEYKNRIHAEAADKKDY